MNNKKVVLWIIIGIVSMIVAIAAAIFIFLYFVFLGGPVQVTKDADSYEETMHKYTCEVVGKVHTGFFAFPETITNSAMDNEPVFYFSYRDTWDDPTCEVYLKCTYSDEDYAGEIDRLKDGLEYEESERFAYPVYKAIDCDNHSYEYAMDLGNNEIAYIYTSFMSDPESLKSIPSDYLPDDYAESLRQNTYDNGGFNVYIDEKTDEYTTFDYGERFK